MAIKDLKEYYDTVAEAYVEMLKEAKDFEKEYKQGHLTEEQLKQMQATISPLKENYERLSYVMLLLNKPRKTSKEKAFYKQNRMLYNYLKDSSSDKVIQEDTDVLVTFRQLIKDLQEDKDKK